jgi:hypothetical protein
LGHSNIELVCQDCPGERAVTLVTFLFAFCVQKHRDHFSVNAKETGDFYETTPRNVSGAACRMYMYGVRAGPAAKNLSRRAELGNAGLCTAK